MAQLSLSTTAADGIKSMVRPYVVGDAVFQTARPSGLSTFRFTLELHDFKTALKQLPEILQADQPPFLSMVYSFDNSMRSVVMYPAETLNCLTLIAKNMKLWQLWDQDPLPTHIRSRTVLIGDAAHAMTPHQGQGRTQAVEDTEGFRLFLQKCVTSEHVPELPKDFDTVRRPRASQIQDNTRKAKNKRTAEGVYMLEKINWTYGGIMEELKAVEETTGMRICK
ncbi:hypothetical protein FVER53590_07698 [Fusarium verticillioides]|nr:hypothetical protein FVER53590_07698 [Fusarium verticillioides]